MYAQLTRIGRSSAVRLNQPDRPETYVAIGNFDGVHTGHRTLFNRLSTLRGSDHGEIVALSFYPHPSVKLGRVAEIPRITTLRQKLSAFAQIGVNRLCLIHFTEEFSQLSTAQFVEQILIERLNAGLVVIGEDARVGRGGEGTASILMNELSRRGRRCEIVQLLSNREAKVSSRRIREAVTAGRVNDALELLGVPFALDARVVPGDGRGSTINFPTANLHIYHQVMPANGVYVCRLVVAGQSYLALTNIGTRPTFNGQGVRAETYVIDAPASIGQQICYGTRCQVEFFDRIRPEKRFDSVAELQAQIHRDILVARQTRTGAVRP